MQKSTFLRSKGELSSPVRSSVPPPSVHQAPPRPSQSALPCSACRDAVDAADWKVFGSGCCSRRDNSILTDTEKDSHPTAVIVSFLFALFSPCLTFYLKYLIFSLWWLFLLTGCLNLCCTLYIKAHLKYLKCLFEPGLYCVTFS